jgi:3-deoxy-D-manno-octulosonic-acid transferase
MLGPFFFVSSFRMYLLYSLILTTAFVVLSPLFLLRREKYLPGFRQRLGKYATGLTDSRPVIWLHCVSVGETNAARPLFRQLADVLPSYQLVVSTTTRTGQQLARDIYGDRATVIYFPFDWKFTVRRALKHFRPSVVLLMETEIWPRFIKEANENGTKIAIVNGRLSERSKDRYLKIGPSIRRVLTDIDRLLMQTDEDAKRVVSLGAEPANVKVTGNLKFDIDQAEIDTDLINELEERFELSEGVTIIAASTHAPEESIVLQAFAQLRKQFPGHSLRLIVAPRHPERFDEVANVAGQFGSFARRSSSAARTDKQAEVILLDSIGELRSVFSLGDIVFVGGSLIPHGGQSILEPAAAGKAIIIGPHIFNFKDAVERFDQAGAIVRLRSAEDDRDYIQQLTKELAKLIDDRRVRDEMAANAHAVMHANRGATQRTINELERLVSSASSAK